jgi:hypothetical protein
MSHKKSIVADTVVGGMVTGAVSTAVAVVTTGYGIVKLFD